MIDTGNLEHSTVGSGEFWEAIGGKISNSMDHKVGTADGQSEGLKVLGVGEPWPIYVSRRNGRMFYPRTPSDSRIES